VLLLLHEEEDLILMLSSRRPMKVFGIENEDESVKHAESFIFLTNHKLWLIEDDDESCSVTLCSVFFLNGLRERDTKRQRWRCRFATIIIVRKL
jgi:hypothetical protein